MYSNNKNYNSIFFLYIFIVLYNKEMKGKKNNESKNNSLLLKNIINDEKINDIKTFIMEKNSFIQEIIRNTIISIKKNKILEIFSNNDITISINVLNELYEKTREIENKVNESSFESNLVIEILQKIIVTVIN